MKNNNSSKYFNGEIYSRFVFGLLLHLIFIADMSMTSSGF